MKRSMTSPGVLFFFFFFSHRSFHHGGSTEERAFIATAKRRAEDPVRMARRQTTMAECRWSQQLLLLERGTSLLRECITNFRMASS